MMDRDLVKPIIPGPRKKQADPPVKSLGNSDDFETMLRGKVRELRHMAGHQGSSRDEKLDDDVLSRKLHGELEDLSVARMEAMPSISDPSSFPAILLVTETGRSNVTRRMTATIDVGDDTCSGGGKGSDSGRHVLPIPTGIPAESEKSKAAAHPQTMMAAISSLHSASEGIGFSAEEHISQSAGWSGQAPVGSDPGKLLRHSHISELSRHDEAAEMPTPFSRLVLEPNAVVFLASPSPGSNHLQSPTQQIGDSLRAMVMNAEVPQSGQRRDEPLKSLRIVLQPETLGTVELSMSFRGGKLHVRMTVSEASTVEILQRDHRQLERLIEQTGGDSQAAIVSIQAETLNVGGDAVPSSGGQSDGRTTGSGGGYAFSRQDENSTTGKHSGSGLLSSETGERETPILDLDHLRRVIVL